MGKYIVYCHIFPNGKRYVGITKQKPQKRWNNGTGYITQDVIFNAIQKYGWHNIEHRILYEDVSKDIAEALEVKLIREWKTTDRHYGYNIEGGGNLNKEISEETRQKLSISHKGQVPWLKGRKHTEEAKEMNRQKHLGKQPWNKGKPQSKDAKLKMSVSKKRLYETGWRPSNSKKVICLETGVVYESAKYAGRCLNIQPSHISSCCTGNRKSVGGLHFQHFKGGDVK